MKRYILTTMIGFIFLAFVAAVYAVSDSVVITQEVSGVAAVCGNGACESGESVSSCPADCAVAVPTPGRSVVDIFPPEIYDFQTRLTHNSAEISWKTSEPALSQFLWGKTIDYEQQGTSQDKFRMEYSVLLQNLDPATLYYFKIIATDRRGNAARVERSFTTLPFPDFAPPANVQNFTATPGDSQIALAWRNPPDADFKAVKILRSTLFYPQDPLDGEVVYNADGESFTDTGLINGVGYYYTAFAYDRSVNYSSGAIVFAVPGAPPAIVPPPELFPPTAEVPPELRALTLADFEFWQEGKRLPLTDGRLVQAKIGLPLTVVLRYEKAPEVLKTIMITLEKPAAELTGVRPREALPVPPGVKFSEALAARQLFSFLLRVNKEKTAYEATLMPPDEPLIYPLYANVMDFKHQVRKRLEGAMETIFPPQPSLPWYADPRNLRYLIYVLLAILLAGYLGRKIRRKTRKPAQKIAEPTQNLYAEQTQN